MLSRINKLDRDFLYWKNLSLVCPLRNHVTSLLSHQTLIYCVQRWGAPWIRSMKRLHFAKIHRTSTEYNKEVSIFMPPGGTPITAFGGGSARNGYLFQASGIWKGEDFMSLWKDRDTCQLRSVKWLTNTTYGCEKDRTISWFSDLFVFKWRYIYIFSKGFSSRLGMWKRYHL